MITMPTRYGAGTTIPKYVPRLVYATNRINMNGTIEKIVIIRLGMLFQNILDVLIAIVARSSVRMDSINHIVLKSSGEEVTEVIT